MHAPCPQPQTKHVVLIGGGHAHALVLRAWGQAPVDGVRVTVINPGPRAPYSGMLPGFVAGHYTRDALDIDLVTLGSYAGAQLIEARADGIDPKAKRIHIEGQAPISYDVASLDVGITSDMPDLPGFREHAVPAKPLGPFAAEWEAFRAGQGAANIAVIGGGVAGAELILAMAFALRQRGRLGQASLIDRSEAFGVLSQRARGIVRRRMEDLGIAIIEQAEITQVGKDQITLADGRQLRSGFTTGAAGARPYDWIKQTGLALTDGFVNVDRHLRTSDPAIFATGDCAHLTASPRPKAGVYAVRQAPVLFHNLRAVLNGGPLRPYTAQKDYLKLVSLGQKSAMGEKFGLTFAGRVIWAWKDHIDQEFMDQFRKLNRT